MTHSTAHTLLPHFLPQGRALSLTPVDFPCSGADHASKKNRWVPCLSDEQPHPLDSVPKDPFYCPYPPTSLPTPWMAPAPNSRGLLLLKCRPRQAEKQRPPSSPKAKLAARSLVLNLDRDFLLDQRSLKPPEIKIIKTRRPKRKHIQGTKHPSTRTNSEIII